jgi:hypothetical protein
MRPSGDHDADMEAIRYIHDDVVEAIVRGEPVPAVYAPLATFAEQVRVLGSAPAPHPSPELATLFATDLVAAVSGRPDGSRPSGADEVAGPTGRVAGLGRLAKVGLGTSLVAAGVVGAGIAGVLPAAANDAVRGAIEVVSPVDFDHPEDRAPTFGSRVSSDATGESDGENGVDGEQISEDAPGAADRNGGASPGETGLTRANETPAAPHAPDQPAGGSDPGAAVPVQPGDPDGDGVTGNAGAAGGPDTVPSTVPDRGNDDNDDESAGG